MEEGRGKKVVSATYARLAVYQRSYKAALGIHRATAGRRDEEDLVRQLRRASRSIPANIAEGVNLSNSSTETKRFLGMAWRSCDEVRVWLAFCRDLDVLTPEKAAIWEQEYAEIGAMLYRVWQNWRHTGEPG